MSTDIIQESIAVDIVEENIIEVTLIGNDITQNLAATIKDVSDDYIFEITDANTVTVRLTSSAAKTLTIPHTSDVLFPVGTILKGLRWGSGTVSFEAGAGVTILSPESTIIKKRYGEVWAKHVSQNVWVLSGNLALADGDELVLG